MLSSLKQFVAGSDSVLGLEISERGFIAAEASISTDQVCLHRCLGGAWPEGREDNVAQQRGRWLRERLGESGIRGKRAVVCLPRDAVVLKHLTLPASSEQELPSLVLLQAEGRSAVPLDQLCVDFIALPRRADRSGMDVLMATVRTDVVAQYRQLAEAAGLDLVWLGVSPLAASELLVRAVGDALDAPSLLVCPASGRIEMTLIDQQRAVYSQAFRLEGYSADEMALKVVNGAKRVLAASPLPAPASGARHIWMLGDFRTLAATKSALEAELEAAVHILDPLERVEGDRNRQPSAQSASLAAPLGTLLAAARAAHPQINFLAPRRPILKRGRKTRFAVAAALLLAGLGAALWLSLDLRRRELDRRLEFLTTAERQLREQNDKDKGNVEAARIIEQWAEGNVAWLDVMLDFGEQMPLADRAFLTSLRLDVQEGQEHGRVRATGYARDPADVMALNARFLELRDRYQLQPHEIRPNSSDKYYQSRFDLEVNVLAPPADKPASVGGQIVTVPDPPRRDTPVSNSRGDHGET